MAAFFLPVRFIYSKLVLLCRFKYLMKWNESLFLCMCCFSLPPQYSYSLCIAFASLCKTFANMYDVFAYGKTLSSNVFMKDELTVL